jgi:hypothetical protein
MRRELSILAEGNSRDSVPTRGDFPDSLGVSDASMALSQWMTPTRSLNQNIPLPVMEE